MSFSQELFARKDLFSIDCKGVDKVLLGLLKILTEEDFEWKVRRREMDEKYEELVQKQEKTRESIKS